MRRSEFNRRYLTSHEFSLGPLRWRSISMQEAEELDCGDTASLQTFAERLQVLIQQARREGVTSQDLNILLRQHTLGDHHVDA